MGTHVKQFEDSNLSLFFLFLMEFEVALIPTPPFEVAPIPTPPPLLSHVSQKKYNNNNKKNDLLILIMVILFVILCLSCR